MVYTAYNLSLINGSGMQPLMQSVNDNLMFGYYGALMLLTIGVILTIYMMRYNNNIIKAAAASSFICAVFSVFIRLLELCNDFIVIICWLIAAILMMLSFIFKD